MKAKFFFIGFFSALIVAGLSLFSVLKYFENLQKTEISKELKKEFKDFDISIIKIESPVLENLLFSDVKTNKKIEVFEKRFLFVNFWATWCRPCVAEMPELEKLTQDSEIKQLPIQFIFGSEEEKEKIISFVEKKKYNLNFCKLNNKLPIIITKEVLPTTYIFDTQNNIGYKIAGMQSWNSRLIKSFLKSIN